MTAAEKAAEVLAAHVYEEFLGGLNEVWTTCTCGERIDATFGGGKTSAEVFKASWGAHVAQALADAGLLIAAFPDGTAGTLTGDLLTDMAAYARRLKDRAEAAERALATLREAVDRVRGLAEAQATSCQAQHRADHARNWLDVLALIERGTR